ncbi:proline-rich receptor-like protein kinase PERK9 [Iris pallida]|uniref:Proline-rich receptor-like protein kinase PERK9 n=1 Tax=Iris pallida TaxID=29817 RepID=A0AAX6GLS7_IRIPA|nr:proline-rich receptor-like protein kinase PERK9 [Iris pallida]
MPEAPPLLRIRAPSSTTTAISPEKMDSSIRCRRPCLRRAHGPSRGTAAPSVRSPTSHAVGSDDIPGADQVSTSHASDPAPPMPEAPPLLRIRAPSSTTTAISPEKMDSSIRCRRDREGLRGLGLPPSHRPRRDGRVIGLPRVIGHAGTRDLPRPVGDTRSVFGVRPRDKKRMDSKPPMPPRPRAAHRRRDLLHQPR